MGVGGGARNVQRAPIYVRIKYVYIYVLCSFICNCFQGFEACKAFVPFSGLCSNLHETWRM